MGKETLLIVALALCGCLRTKAEPAAKLTIGPAAIDFGSNFAGASPHRVVTVHNDGSELGHARLTVTGPFSIDAAELDLAPGADVVVSVTYAPAKPGHDVGTVTLGAQQVALSGDARPALDCPHSACHEVSFDPNAGACLDAMSLDGKSCASDGCYSQTTHVCESGQCIEQPRVGGRCVNDWVAVAMPARAAPAIAYDSDRQRMVAFGGFSDDGPLNDTWEWDGTRWLELRPVVSPPGHSFANMTYDSRRKRMVLFAGERSVSETWEFDGATWAQRFPVHLPPMRLGASFAFDSDRRVAVLFGGGFSTPQGVVYLNDTWEWDGTDWAQISVATAPSARTSSGMIYDPEAKTMVLVGGNNDWPNGLSDLWHYDGKNWSQLSTTNAPPNDPAPAFVYDVDRHRALELTPFDPASVWELSDATWSQVPTDDQPVFARTYTPGTVYDTAHKQVVGYAAYDWPVLQNTTWAWGGSHWERVDPATPSARAGVGLVYDSRRERVVLFGGGSGGSTLVFPDSPAETWEFDGNNWTVVTTSHTPPPRQEMAMAFDSRRNVVVLFGGNSQASGGDLADTWEYDGFDWNQRLSQHVPPARFGAVASYDAKLKQTVMFGGAHGNLHDSLADTWAWDGLDWTPLNPPNAPGPRFHSSMTYDAAHQHLVLFGGEQFEDAPLDETWVFDGADWSLKGSGEPGTRWNAMMAYDPTRQRVMLFGGHLGAGLSNALYTWDGAAWTMLAAQRPGPTIAGAGMAFDVAHDELLVFGGLADDTIFVADTWLYLPTP